MQKSYKINSVIPYLDMYFYRPVISPEFGLVLSNAELNNVLNIFSFISPRNSYGIQGDK